MANGYFDANALAQYSLNLLRGQMITQLVGGQMCGELGGASLTEFILGRAKPQKRTGTDMMNDALTGLMRSDAAMLRQGSKNMEQGRALLEVGESALSGISEKVGRMREIVDALQNDYSQYSVLEPEYTSLSADIKSVIEGTSFNGLRILDGSTWAADGRVTPNGDTGKLALQAGNSQSELTLYDLQNYKDLFVSADLSSPAQLALTASSLEHFSGMLSGMEESYKARAGLLATEGAGMLRQADILDEATGRAKPGDEDGLRQVLIDILMRENGSVLDGRT